MPQQVRDDIDLLNLMMHDYEHCDGIYKWTNYWAKRCHLLEEFLRTTGLTDFRRNNEHADCRGGVLKTFGATDISPAGYKAEEMYIRADAIGRSAGAVPLQTLSVSEAGNPESFRIADGTYTYSWLNFYIRYAYVCKFFQFGKSTIVELGPGSGKQAELLKKAHPELTIFLFDIPPQLYIVNQYVTSVFGDAVVGYRETRDICDLSKFKRGMIYIFANWKIPLLSDVAVDLFWSAASFQEMEPDVVEAYLATVGPVSENVYLMQMMYGQRQADRPGRKGVLQKTRLHEYLTFLEHHEIVDLSHASLAMPLQWRQWPYSDTFWRRSMS